MNVYRKSGGFLVDVIYYFIVNAWAMKITHIISTALLASTLTGSAAVVAASETFTGAGSVPAGYTFSVSGGYIITSLTQTQDLAVGDAANDGAIFVDGNDAGPPLSTVSFDFTGTIVAGEQYTFTSNLWQSSSSFAQTDVRLLVNGVSAASVDPGTVGTAGQTAVVNYTALAGDAGKTLSFTMSSKRNAGGGSSDLGIDNWDLAVVAVPEPSSTALLGLGGLALILRRRK
jgi:hypothetical protein